MKVCCYNDLPSANVPKESDGVGGPMFLGRRPGGRCGCAATVPGNGWRRRGQSAVLGTLFCLALPLRRHARRQQIDVPHQQIVATPVQQIDREALTVESAR